ncbi:hypothetical protein NBRC116187_14630 [Halopseudomonas sabulinigri]|uniref:Uncharacterized protein n=1 Tax=Halopseudomonas sabulinigri TaxID=472181 RepID=A0ABP9ZNR9_9GAMM
MRDIVKLWHGPCSALDAYKAATRDGQETDDSLISGALPRITAATAPRCSAAASNSPSVPS